METAIMGLYILYVYLGFKVWDLGVRVLGLVFRV